jgi:hypothetical protein
MSGVDLESYAFSFQHGIIKLRDKQYTALSNVGGNQGIERSAVYGTSAKPLKRSAGQAQLGEGTVTFSDLKEALEFYADLGTNPSAVNFNVDATFANPNGDTASIEYIGCNISGFNSAFENGSDALTLEVPFTYMMTRINGVDLVQ